MKMELNSRQSTQILSDTLKDEMKMKIIKKINKDIEDVFKNAIGDRDERIIQ